MNKPPASVSEHGPGLALYECRIRENGWEEPFRYMLLDRLRQDCLYFLGFGNRCERCLWAGNIRDQIGYMKALWNSFPSAGKPEWLPWDEILALEARMTDDISAAGSEGFLPSGTVQSKYPK
ncbi:LPD11 domain-containing protein [Flavonifractor plautii]|jgi:hypothetical protein|uniref:LPD11 domain-containing protein n=1 Tax=Flavonifractor plautii TaxID=292800 RepID=UPI0018973B71|nr:LPD11 domain-containing protein [Flavonifractor plautii]